MKSSDSAGVAVDASTPAELVAETGGGGAWLSLENVSEKEGGRRGKVARTRRNRAASRRNCAASNRRRSRAPLREAALNAAERNERGVKRNGKRTVGERLAAAGAIAGRLRADELHRRRDARGDEA